MPSQAALLYHKHHNYVIIQQSHDYRAVNNYEVITDSYDVVIRKYESSQIHDVT